MKTIQNSNINWWHGKILSTLKIQSNIGNNKIQITERILSSPGLFLLKWIEEDKIINHTILFNIFHKRKIPANNYQLENKRF